MHAAVFLILIASDKYWEYATLTKLLLLTVYYNTQNIFRGSTRVFTLLYMPSLPPVTVKIKPFKTRSVQYEF